VSDLVVVGAGTMGAWTALHAARGGRRTTLVDAFGPGHSRATSGDETRIIRSSHGPDAFYTRWSRRAREAWMQLAAEAGEPLFLETGVLWFAHREDGFEAASLATLASEGIAVERLTPGEVESRWPQTSAAGLAFAAFEPEAGVLMARRGVAAAARASSWLACDPASGPVTGFSRSSPTTERGSAAMPSCSPPARGCRPCSRKS
jgi:sarcosine oxidase